MIGEVFLLNGERDGRKQIFEVGVERLRELVSGNQKGDQMAGGKQLVVGGHLVVTGKRDWRTEGRHREGSGRH